MSEKICQADGWGGDISVYPTKVVITRKVIEFNGMNETETDILISKIQGIRFYEAKSLSIGYIKFLMAGDNPNAPISYEDTNLVKFKKKQNENMLVVKNEVNKLIEKNQAKSETTVINQVSAADELKKYKELLETGVITQEDFDAKKKQLLGI